MVQLSPLDSPSVRNAHDYFAELGEVLALVPAQALNRAIELLLEARSTGRRVYIMGNGGSAATASHFVCDRGARTIGILGFDGGKALDLVDVPVHVPCNDYGLVEDTHAAIGHAITAAIRRQLQTTPVP
jgi:phosphoheptose isomerase